MAVAFVSAYDAFVPAFSGKQKESGILVRAGDEGFYNPFKTFPLPTGIRNADLSQVAEYLSRFGAVQAFIGAHLVVVRGNLPGETRTIEEIVGHPIREAADLQAVSRAFRNSVKKDEELPDVIDLLEEYVKRANEMGWYFCASPETPSQVTESGVVAYTTGDSPPERFPLFTHTAEGPRQNDEAFDALGDDTLVKLWYLLSTRRFDRVERQKDGTYAHIFYEPLRAAEAAKLFAQLFPSVIR